MYSIDEIMDMLDGFNPEELQERGRKLAKDIRCINVFFQPSHAGHKKNVWDNCAKIIAERTDEELKPYLNKMFQWLIDMNWPGAYIIYDRLLCFEDKEFFNHNLKKCINEAKALEEQIWLSVLIKLCVRYNGNL